MQKVKVKFKKLHPDAKLPERADELCGGWDVICTEIIQESNDFVICKLGFALEIPAGYKVTLVPRSSFTKYKWILQNSPGLGDASYVGEYQYRFRALPKYTFLHRNDIADVICRNNYKGFDLEYPDFPYQVGDRIGQIYLEEVIPIEFEEVEELSETVRGTGGFGSSGN
jgi:dUTP pyrophosphatase